MARIAGESDRILRIARQDLRVGFAVGQVMKSTKGSANPRVVNERITAELKVRAGSSQPLNKKVLNNRPN